MGYSTGMMNKRVKVVKRVSDPTATFGKSGQPKYEWLNPDDDHAFWFAVDGNRGIKAMREGALDAYATKMFRCRYHEGMDEWSLLQYKGTWYQIESFDSDYEKDTTQITAVSRQDQKVEIVEPAPEPTPEPVNPEPQNEGTINNEHNDNNNP